MSKREAVEALRDIIACCEARVNDRNITHETRRADCAAIARAALARVALKEQAEAREIIAKARAALGADVRGLTDLLLDNMPSLGSVEDARALLREIGEAA